MYLEETSSTNSYAHRIIQNNLITDGTLVFTDFQTKGVGQRGKPWQSEARKNLLGSFILKPRFDPLKGSFINFAATLGIFEAINEYFSGRVKIKWPNDILVDNLKIGGILIENVIVKEKIKFTVVGIGINVNQTQFDGLEDVTSFSLLTGDPERREDIMNEISNKLEENYNSLLDGELSYLKKRFEQNLKGIEQNIKYIDKKTGEQSTGKLVGVSDEGSLVIENGKEALHFTNGAIEIVN
ncbi:MAG: Bifunctional ligase/repressor BirA [Bacteroidetes bacterium MED-G17]|nr:MAG: Bifunctional ligase/repressor BirA [Bacteroidetes bacterium MED-G17]